jgi:hypothetical protein
MIRRGLQLVTVRWLGTFLEDPLDVPGGVLDFVAGQQLGMADPSTVKRYTEREHTRNWPRSRTRSSGSAERRRDRAGIRPMTGR